MNIVLTSLFANSESSGHLSRYIPQVVSLKNAFESRGDKFRAIWTWGDSTDATEAALHRHAKENGIDATIVEYTHGYGAFKSIELPLRFKVLSGVGNRGLAEIRDTDDCYLLVESDLQWDADVLVKLVSHLTNPKVNLVAPLVWFMNVCTIDEKGWFYDTFACRKNGVRFGPWYPYHECLSEPGDLVEIDSAGSCIAVRASLAKRARYSPVDSVVGFCRDVAQLGNGGIYLDKRLSIVHPKRVYDV